MIQKNLFDSKMETQFKKFHKENPHVYKLLVKYTFQALNAGHSHYGIAGIYERARWHSDIETNDCEFKLNNNHKPFYARLIMSQYPESLTGFFIIREQTSGGKAYEETEEQIHGKCKQCKQQLTGYNYFDNFCTFRCRRDWVHSKKT